jgi:hypothetical protein
MRTPTPWRAVKFADIKSTTIQGPDGKAIGNFRESQHAEDAVLAVNNHDALVANLSNLLSWSKRVIPKELSHAQLDAESALKKVGAL